MRAFRRRLMKYGAVFIPVIKRYLPTKRGKLPFYISEEQLSHFEYSDTPIPVSEITRRINDLADDERRKKLRATDMGNYYRIAPDGRSLNYDKFYVEGNVLTESDEAYTSHNTTRLDVDGVVKKIMSTDYVKEELEGKPHTVEA